MKKRRTFSVRPKHYLLAGDLSRVMREPVAVLVERLLEQEARRLQVPIPDQGRVEQWFRGVLFRSRQSGHQGRVAKQ